MINLILTILNEDLGEPVEKLSLEPRQARAWQGKRIHLSTPSQPHELSLIFPVQIQQSQNVYQ